MIGPPETPDIINPLAGLTDPQVTHEKPRSIQLRLRAAKSEAEYLDNIVKATSARLAESMRHTKLNIEAEVLAKLDEPILRVFKDRDGKFRLCAISQDGLYGNYDLVFPQNIEGNCFECPRMNVVTREFISRHRGNNIKIIDNFIESDSFEEIFPPKTLGLDGIPLDSDRRIGKFYMSKELENDNGLLVSDFLSRIDFSMLSHKFDAESGYYEFIGTSPKFEYTHVGADPCLYNLFMSDKRIFLADESGY